MILGKVALIIVTFNRFETLKKNLEYIRSQSQKPDYCLIVDNGSKDGTVPFLLEQNEFNFLLKEENQGYGAGLHEGIEYGMKTWSPDYFWLMDDDSFPNPEVLSSLYQKAEEIQLEGILGSLGFKLKNGIPRAVSREGEVQLADFVLVDNALLSRSAIEKIGNFRTDLFMMCEDYDLCFRMKKNELFVGVFNSDKVKVERQHMGSQINSINLVWRGYYHSRNLYLILKDNFSWKNFIYYFHRQGKYVFHSVLFGEHRWLRTKFRVLGILDGIKGVTGKTIDPLTLKRIHKS